MANLKDIRRRIKSIKNTQKITQAMRMVAAAKVKKTEARVKASRPYANGIYRVFKKVLAAHPDLLDATPLTDKPIDNFPVLMEVREIKTLGLLIISSDKGLCGSYNTNIVKYVTHKIKECQEAGIVLKLFIVGNKAYNALKRHPDANITKKYSGISALPTSTEAGVITEDLAESYVNQSIDAIKIVTTRFRSMVSYKIEEWDVLPVSLDDHVDDPHEEHHSTVKAEELFEPSVEHVLQKLIPMYLTYRIYHALLEGSASELAARMSAMTSATNNAKEMVGQLTIDYNKARQASITQEILEIVSGAEALK